MSARIRKISKTKKEKAVEITKTIISAIGATALIGGVIVFPGIAPMIKWIEKLTNDRSSRSRYAISRLKNRKLVNVKLSKRRIILNLTPKGRRQHRRYVLRNFKIKKPKKWDRQWRIVMFDIPENNKSARDSIRRRLIDLGFANVQKSVFVHAFPCDDVIKEIREYYGLPAGQLYVFDAQIKEGEDKLKKFFKL